MIPLQLTIKNFMCYRDDVPTLEFESVHVACLCGDNGHGKTALLDAITWALWGQARARTQEELVHQGQMDMAVELDFLALGQRYRVSRRHSRSARSRQGTTLLELQVASEGDNGFRPITGNTVRDTEARIREILHMDYDTFINTAFLMQGQADLFTRSTPSKRKECLAEVLDLSYYQRLEERARSQSRSVQDEMRNVESGIELRRREITQKPEYEEQLASVKATLARITPEAEALREKVETLRNTVLSLRGQQGELERLSERLAGVQGDVSNLERQLSSHESKVAEYQQTIQREQEIRESFAQLEKSRAELARLDQALSRKSQLDSEKAKLEQEVARQEERLSAQVAQLGNRIARELEPKANRLPEIEEGLRNMALHEEELASLGEVAQQRRGEAEEVEAELERLNQALTRKSELDSQRARVEQEIAVQKERLSAQAGQLRNRITQDLEPRASRLPSIEEDVRLIALEEEELPVMAETLRQRRGESEEIEVRIHYLKQVNEALYKEMEDSRSKFDMLEQGEAVCPLCKKPLDAEGKEHLRMEYESQGLERKQQYKANDAEQETLDKQQKELVALVSRLEADLDKKRRHVQGRSATLTRDLEEARKAKEDLQGTKTELEKVEDAIRTEDFAQEERAKLALLDNELSTLSYDAEKRRQAQERARESREQASLLEADLNQRTHKAQKEKNTLERDLKDSANARDEIEKVTIELQQAEGILHSQSFASAERERLAQLELDLSALDFDSDKHGVAREQVKALEPYADLHRKLLEAVERLPLEREAQERSRQMLEQRRREIQEAVERKALLEEALKSLPAQESQLQETEATYKGIEKQKDAALVRQGVLEQQIERCNVMEAEIREQEKEHRRLAEEKGIYDDLTAAFGKNGIQALIIESAMPQLEADANDLLGRLTENRMFLRLQLQEGRKDSRTGLPSEELDIKIADEVGTRSYETFSGGEAFRINFALRIALSKLLARRSGAPLPILFIDEGFGSQDRVGQERLTEAIQSIQDDFEKIIVITHIEQVKEAFPVRIEVTKNGSGSTFQIV